VFLAEWRGRVPDAAFAFATDLVKRTEDAYERPSSEKRPETRPVKMTSTDPPLTQPMGNEPPLLSPPAREKSCPESEPTYSMPSVGSQ
jgi:hypothetical protein